MLPKQLRLPPNKIPKLAYKGKKLPFDKFVIRYQQTDSNPQFAISISKKVHKSAVVRNKVKRAIRRAIAAKASSLPNGDYLVLVKNFDLSESDAEKYLMEIPKRLAD